MSRNGTLALALSFFVIFSGQLAAQQVSEKEVELEGLFIDADRERILGNFDKAIPIYEEILKKDAANHAAAYELARIYAAREDPEKAMQYARKAVELDAGNIWYQQFLAEVYQTNGRNREAAAIYEQLVKRDPDREELYFKWAYFLVRANDIERAVKVYDQLEARIGITEELIRRKHTLYLGAGDVKRAGRELERLILAFPNQVEYQQLLAEFYEQTGDKEKARQVYQRILELSPDDVKARLALTGGAPRAASGEIEYLQSLRPIFEKPGTPIDPKIQSIMPVILRVADTRNRELGEAALELTSILERVYPDEAKAFAASGDLLFAIGRRKEAIAKYQRTLALDDRVYLVWQQLLSALSEERDFNALRKTSEAAMDLFPNKAENYYYHALANSRLGQHKDALDDLQQGLLMAGNDQALTLAMQVQLGQVYQDLGQIPQSEKAFESALALSPQSREALSGYSYALAQRGEKLDKALQMAEQLNKLTPDQAEYQHIYGWVYYKLKSYAQAKQWIGRALERGGDQDPQILEHYGDVLYQMDDADGALRYWRLAQEKGGNSKSLEKKINDKQLHE